MKNVGWIFTLFLFVPPAVEALAQNTSSGQTVSPETRNSITTELEDLRNRLDQLEKQSSEDFYGAHEGSKTVRSFLPESMLLGGFFENSISYFDGPHTEAQLSASAHILGINLAAEMSVRDRFVTQILTAVGYTLGNPHNDPRGTPASREYTTPTVVTIMAQGYYEHSFSELVKIQTGMGYVPFGHAFQQRELVLFKRLRGPQMINAGSTGDSVGIAFPLWLGVHLHGSRLLDGNRWGYNSYTFSPNQNPGSLGFGGRLWYRFKERATFGLSAQSGELTNHYYNTFGADLDYNVSDYGITLEYARNTPTGAGEEPNESYYVLPYYNLADGKITIYATYDYLDIPSAVTGTLADPHQRTDIGGGFNWLPRPTVRLRLGYLQHNYHGNDTVVEMSSRRYYSVDFSAGIAF